MFDYNGVRINRHECNHILRRDTHRDDNATLYEHVVDGCRDGPRTDPIRVGRGPSYLHRVDVGVTSDQSDHREVGPRRRLLGEGVEGDEERQCPELKQDSGNDATVDDLTQVAECDQQNHAEELGRYAEEIGLRGGIAEVPKGERKVRLRWLHGN